MPLITYNPQLTDTYTRSSVGLKCSFELLPPINERPPRRNTLAPVPFQGRLFTVHSRFDFSDRAITLLARSAADDFPDNIKPYLEGLNKWLPVVDGSDLEAARCQNATSFEDETFPALFLACVLLSRISTLNPVDVDTQGNRELYLMLTTSHTSLLSRGVTSLYLLQSKILLALYEFLQDNRIAVLGTLASAAAMVDTMGLFCWHCQTKPDVISIDIAEYRVVCCLYVLER